MAIVNQITTSQFHVTLNANERKIITDYAALTDQSRSQAISDWIQRATAAASLIKAWPKLQNSEA